MQSVLIIGAAAADVSHGFRDVIRVPVLNKKRHEDNETKKHEAEGNGGGES
jgi:hypothetical protein